MASGEDRSSETGTGLFIKDRASKIDRKQNDLESWLPHNRSLDRLAKPDWAKVHAANPAAALWAAHPCADDLLITEGQHDTVLTRIEEDSALQVGGCNVCL